MAAASSSNGDVTQVQVRFVTTTVEAIVPDSTLSVPVTLARYGLSEIVNALTQQSTPTPYDFLIDGRFLRTDLATHIADNKLSPEAIITLEYVAALPAPSSLPSRPHPDWVSAVVASHSTFVVTGCYDKHVRIFNHESTTAISAGVGHTAAVKSVARMDDGKDTSTMYIVSGSKDRSVRLWRYDGASSSSRLVPLAIGIGHEDSVDAVATCRGSTDMYCSGGWDKRILIWQAPSGAGLTAAAATDSKVVGKRRRTDKSATDDADMDNEDDSSDAKRASASSSTAAAASKTTGSRATSVAIEQSPMTRLEGEHGHAAAVSAVCWPNALTLYSGSWDHTVRQWDPINPTSPVHTWNGSKVVTSLVYNATSGTLASGHHDNIIRLWDARSRDGEAMKLTLRSHRGWVSGVTWRVDNAHILASTSYDGTVKVWDIRASIPLHTLTAVHGGEKGLAIDWNANGDIWTGGADCKLQRFHQA